MSTIQYVRVRLEGVQVRLGEYEDYWGCASTKLFFFSHCAFSLTSLLN